MKAARAIYSFALLALTLLSTVALTPSQRSAIRTALESAKSAELPQVAETLMSDANVGDRRETAKIILEYVIAKRAAAVRPVFASLSKLYPEAFVAVLHTDHRIFAAHEPLASGLQMIPIHQSRPNIPLPPTPPLPTLNGTSSSHGGSASSSSGVLPGRILTPRGALSGPTTALVTQSKTPINTTAGGNGDGTFNGAAATPANSGPIFDYSQPRH
jgi:hypothetical protein